MSEAGAGRFLHQDQRLPAAAQLNTHSARGAGRRTLAPSAPQGPHDDPALGSAGLGASKALWNPRQAF